MEHPAGKIGLTVMAVLVTGAAMLYAAEKPAYPTYAYRYRMILEVDVRGATRSAASIIEVRLTKQHQFSPEVPSVAASVTGEALFLDLGMGQNIIAILAAGPFGDYVDYPQHVVPQHFALSYTDRDLELFPRLKGNWELEGKWLPTLVTFSDLNDPKTARVVHPQEFEQVFGSGVRFRRVWVEMTTDPVTQTIESRLPFLQSLREAQKGKVVPSYPGKLTIVPGRFISE